MINKGDFMVIRDDVTNVPCHWHSAPDQGHQLYPSPQPVAIVGPVGGTIRGARYLSACIDGEWLDVWDSQTNAHLAWVIQLGSRAGQAAAKAFGVPLPGEPGTADFVGGQPGQPV